MTPPDQTIKILLVDDEPRNLDALEAILDDPAYVRLRAENADAALKLLLEHDVAAIVLDIKMPGVSGFELAQLIKGTKRFRHIPIVFLTAYMVDEKDVMAGYGSGAVDYLTKPINPLILQHKVAVFADLFRKTRALAAANEQLEQLNQKLEARVSERTAELKERSEELERASRMKDEFLATLSHELRTPLNAVVGWASILKRDPHNAEKVARGIEVIERNAMLQERLVTELLDVSRIVSGKLLLKPTRFALASVIRAAADVVRPAADAKGIGLVVDIDPSVGDVIGDAARLQQVVWNLLSNAIKYTPSGGRATVTARRTDSVDVVRVEDTGAGIPAEHLPHIFERFRQVDSSTTRAHGGLGIGLALVRHLVEAHGGTVEARSEGPGRGAAFTVFLPVRAVAIAEAEPSEAQAEAPGARPQRRVELADVRVLVVDDNEDSVEVVRVVLEEAGASVTTAASAAEALGVLDGQRPVDVIVSDIGMPGMDGHALMRRIRAAGELQTVPAIALTAYARGEDVVRAKRAGYQEHLTKPVDSRKLVETVKALVGASEDARAPARASRRA